MSRLTPSSNSSAATITEILQPSRFPGRYKDKYRIVGCIKGRNIWIFSWSRQDNFR